jgi:hypothetical protein
MHKFLKFMFGIELYIFRTGSLSIIRSPALYTQEYVYVITGYADCLLASSQHNLYDIYLLLCIQCWTADDGQRTCPKDVEFYSKNKFEKFVHLVGFITRIYHNAWSHEYITMHGHVNTSQCTVTWIHHNARSREYITMHGHMNISQCTFLWMSKSL